MNVGPFTFQWACLHCVCRSMHSASRWLSSPTASRRLASGRSFFVGYARVAARERFSGTLGRDPASSRRGVVVRVIFLLRSELRGGQGVGERTYPERRDQLHGSERELRRPRNMEPGPTSG